MTPAMVLTRRALLCLCLLLGQWAGAMHVLEHGTAGHHETAATDSAGADGLCGLCLAFGSLSGTLPAGTAPAAPDGAPPRAVHTPTLLPSKGLAAYSARAPPPA